MDKQDDIEKPTVEAPGGGPGTTLRATALSGGGPGTTLKVSGPTDGGGGTTIKATGGPTTTIKIKKEDVLGGHGTTIRVEGKQKVASIKLQSGGPDDIVMELREE